MQRSFCSDITGKDKISSMFQVLELLYVHYSLTS